MYGKTGDKSPMYGTKMPEEHRKRLILINTGKKASDETREKMSDARRGPKSHNYGKNLSEEHKQKISNSLKGPNNINYGLKREEHSKLMSGSGNPRSRKVICITTGEVFDCAKDGGVKHNTTNSNILKCCKHRQKRAGHLTDGTELVWMYLEEYQSSPSLVGKC